MPAAPTRLPAVPRLPRLGDLSVAELEKLGLTTALAAILDRYVEDRMAVLLEIVAAGLGRLAVAADVYMKAYYDPVIILVHVLRMKNVFDPGDTKLFDQARAELAAGEAVDKLFELEPAPNLRQIANELREWIRRAEAVNCSP
jgi:hypothetical protein